MDFSHRSRAYPRSLAGGLESGLVVFGVDVMAWSRLISSTHFLRSINLVQNLAVCLGARLDHYAQPDNPEAKAGLFRLPLSLSVSRRSVTTSHQNSLREQNTFDWCWGARKLHLCFTFHLTFITRVRITGLLRFFIFSGPS